MTDTPRRFARIAPHEWEGLSGMQVLERVIDGRLPQLPMAGTLGFAVVEAAEGQAVVAGEPDEGHVNLIGTVHAGWAATVLDTAMACAVISTLQPHESFTTMEFKISLLKPVQAGMGELRGTGVLLQRGRRGAFAEARLQDATGKVLAHATTTCIIVPKT